MASSLFGSNPSKGNGNNLMDMLKQFEQFKRQMAGKDPQAMVQQMLQSGQMSQQQFQKLSQMATQLSSFLR